MCTEKEMDIVGKEKPEMPTHGKELRIEDIGERMWPYLEAKARKLINSGVTQSVLQFDRGEDGKIYPLRPIWNPTNRPDQKYTREIHPALSLNKMVKTDTPVVPEKWIRRFALLVNKLSEAGKIKYGILGPPVSLPLALIEPQHRILLLLYCYSDSDAEELNDWLKNKAFTEEGGMGNDDWSNLPE